MSKLNEKFSSLPLPVWLSALALKRPVTCIMIMLSLFVTGLVASQLLKKESWPAVNAPVAFIQVPYQGATPTEVERLITRPIEEAVATMSGISQMSSRSRADSAQIQLMMQLNSDLDDKILEVREKVDMVRHLLPDDVDRIYVQKFNTEDIPVINLVLSSDRNLSQAFNFLDREIRQRLERIKGVGKVEFRGVARQFVEIELDSTKVAMNRIDQGKLLQDLRANNFLVRSGSILDHQRKLRVSPTGEYQSLDDIRNFPVKNGVRLVDIASVTLSMPEKRNEHRTNGKRAVLMEVFKESDANVVEVTSQVVALVDKLKSEANFSEIDIAIHDDMGAEIQRSLDDLLKAGTFGIGLSFIVLYFFLRNAKITSVVVVSVPISLSFALAAMYFLGYTLNMLTLAGLFIAVGLLIDNSVVICESILQQQNKQLSRVQKILTGVDNVSIAIISGTLTTTIVFLPLLMGEKNFITIIIEQVAVAICLPLLASLIIAKTAIPLMLSRVKEDQLSNALTQGKLDFYYRKMLKATLTYPKRAGLVTFVLIISGLFAQGLVSSNQDFEKAERDLYINYHIQGELELKEVTKLVDEMEAYLEKNKASFYIEKINSGMWSDWAWTRLKIKRDIDIPIHELKEKISKGFPITALARPSFKWSEQRGKVARVSISGSSTEKLVALSDSIIPKLKAVEEFAEVDFDRNSKKTELLLRIDSAKSARLGATTQDIAGRISTALRGASLRTFRHGEQGEIAIRLTYYPERAIPLEDIKKLPIFELEGKVILLQELVTFDTQPVMSQISRMQRETNITLSIGLKDINRLEAAEKIKEVMDNVALPSGYSWQLGRQFQQDDDSLKDMGINMLLALALIFMVMAALFESLLMPIAILSSIFLAFIGVYWTFVILNLGMSETGMIGMLILMGIVVNNGIVLIDQINKMKGSASSLLQPITEACVSRIRPIFMTVATTVIGMIPVAIASKTNDAYPMAMAIIGGLIFSTFTSLFLVPYCYLMLVRLGERSKRRMALAKAFANRRVSTVK